MIKPYIFVFSAVVTKNIEIPDGMNEDGLAFEDLILSEAKHIDVNEFADLEDCFPEDELESEPVAEPSLLS